MTSNKKNINTILNFILLLILAYFIYQQYIQYIQYTKYNENRNLDTFINNNSKTCTINLNDIDPRTVDEYNQFNGKVGAWNDCVGAKIIMNINTCAINKNGSPLSSCNPNANIDKVTNLNNMVYNQSVLFPTKVSVDNIKYFLGI